MKQKPTLKLTTKNCTLCVESKRKEDSPEYQKAGENNFVDDALVLIEKRQSKIIWPAFSGVFIYISEAKKQSIIITFGPQKNKIESIICNKVL